jgi:drug/metabolite transporter (DMT)-like permease
MGLAFMPMLFLGDARWSAAGVPWAIAAGVLFFLGQVGTFRSLHAGDVSIATPALATKVVFVALLSLALPAKNPDPDLWIAVGLTMAGVVLLHQGPRHHASRPWTTLGWALFAALSFASADILVQQVAARTGITLFLPVMFGTVTLISLPLLVPHLPRAGEARAGAWRWGSAGIILLAVQATGVVGAIGWSGDATGVNVVYSSRGLWSLVLVAFVAHRLGVAEGTRDPRTLLARLAGGVLILIAVLLVVL